MSTEEFRQKFDEWVMRNAGHHGLECNYIDVEYIVYTSVTPSFNSYDDWKLASDADYYDEKTGSEAVSIDELFDFILEEIDVLFEECTDRDFEKLFDRWYEEKSEELSNQ